MCRTRAERAAAREAWADEVEADAMLVAGTDALRSIAELAARRDEVDAALLEAVRSAGAAHRSWWRAARGAWARRGRPTGSLGVA